MKAPKKALAALVGFGLGTAAFAEDPTVFGQAISLDTTQIVNAASVVVIALAAIWGIKKVVALMNKS